MTPREWLDGFHRGRCAARMTDAQANTRPTTNYWQPKFKDSGRSVAEYLAPTKRAGQ